MSTERCDPVVLSWLNFRVTELLDANNGLVERARTAERRAAIAEDAIGELRQQLYANKEAYKVVLAELHRLRALTPASAD